MPFSSLSKSDCPTFPEKIRILCSREYEYCRGSCFNPLSEMQVLVTNQSLVFCTAYFLSAQGSWL